MNNQSKKILHQKKHNPIKLTLIRNPKFKIMKIRKRKLRRLIIKADQEVETIRSKEKLELLKKVILEKEVIGKIRRTKIRRKRKRRTRKTRTRKRRTKKIRSTRKREVKMAQG